MIIVYSVYMYLLCVLSHDVYTSTSPHQNAKEGENGGYVVSGFWDVGIPFLASLNEETSKCETSSV